MSVNPLPSKDRINQRVMIIIDGDNLSDMSERTGKIDIAKLCQLLTDDRVLTEAAFFVSIPFEEKREFNHFVFALRRNGLRVIDTPMRKQTNKDGSIKIKGYSDSKIWRFILDRLDYFDTLVLATRDGDYADILDYISIRHGKQTELCAIWKGMDQNLLKVVNFWWNLSDPTILEGIRLIEIDDAKLPVEEINES